MILMKETVEIDEESWDWTSLADDNETCGGTSSYDDEW